jgi:hypothetical protein
VLREDAGGEPFESFVADEDGYTRRNGSAPH